MTLDCGLLLQRNQQNTIKDPHRYAVHGSDTTMLPRAASSPGQQNFYLLLCPLRQKKSFNDKQLLFDFKKRKTENRKL